MLTLTRFPMRVLAFGSCLLVLAAPVSADDAAGLRLFREKIEPVLVDQCYRCHSAAAES